MDRQLLKLFALQIWTQCRFALIALQDLQTQLADSDAAQERAQRLYAGLAVLPPEAARVQAMAIAMEWPSRAWYPIQAFLTAVANISKSLWGQGGMFATERQQLRLVLGVPDGSPIGPTGMRNNFDHFDERLTSWWKSSSTHNYVDLSFGDPGRAISGIPESEMFRSYDPGTGDVIFWGSRYNIPEIAGEIERLSELALGEAAH